MVVFCLLIFWIILREVWFLELVLENFFDLIINWQLVFLGRQTCINGFAFTKEIVLITRRVNFFLNNLFNLRLKLNHSICLRLLSWCCQIRFLFRKVPDLLDIDDWYVELFFDGGLDLRIVLILDWVLVGCDLVIKIGKFFIFGNLFFDEKRIVFGDFWVVSVGGRVSDTIFLAGFHYCKRFDQHVLLNKKY